MSQQSRERARLALLNAGVPQIPRWTLTDRMAERTAVARERVAHWLDAAWVDESTMPRTVATEVEWLEAVARRGRFRREDEALAVPGAPPIITRAEFRALHVEG